MVKTFFTKNNDTRTLCRGESWKHVCTHPLACTYIQPEIHVIKHANFLAPRCTHTQHRPCIAMAAVTASATASQRRQRRLRRLRRRRLQQRRLRRPRRRRRRRRQPLRRHRHGRGVGHLAGAVESCSASQRRREPRPRGRLRRAIKRPADTARPLCTRRPLAPTAAGRHGFSCWERGDPNGTTAAHAHPLFCGGPTVTYPPPSM